MTAMAGPVPTPVSIHDLRGAARTIRRVALWVKELDPAVKVALEAEAARLDDTVSRVRTIQRITQGDE
jgi:hypothetical protein